MRILLVEDDKMIGGSLQKALKQSGYAVNWATDGETADLALDNDTYDLMILDLGLPRKEGLAVLDDLRKREDNTPVLILTARDSVSDRVKGLDSGADDYVLKPFALEELEARVRRLLRRKAGQSSATLTHGQIQLDPSSHEAVYGERRAILSGREFSLLYALIKSPGAILSKAQLEDAIYGWNEEVGSNAIEVHIHQIRKKLGQTVIKNIRNVGYKLDDAA